MSVRAVAGVLFLSVQRFLFTPSTTSFSDRLVRALLLQPPSLEVSGLEQRRCRLEAWGAGGAACMLGCSVPGDGSYHSSIVVGFFPGGGAFPRSTAAGFSCREGEASSDPPSSVFVYGVRRLAKLRAAVLEPGFFWVVVSKVMCVKCRWGFRCKGVASGHCGGALEMRMLSGDGVDLQDRKKAAVLV